VELTPAQCEICLAESLSCAEIDAETGIGLKANHTGTVPQPLSVKDSLGVLLEPMMVVAGPCPSAVENNGVRHRSPILDSMNLVQTSLKNKCQKICKEHLRCRLSAL
jgi:hypothetical protein